MARGNWTNSIYTSTSTSSTTTGNYMYSYTYEPPPETPLEKVMKAVRKYVMEGNELGEIAMHPSMMNHFNKVLSGPEEKWPNGVRLYKWDVGGYVEDRWVTVIFDARMPHSEYFIGPFGSWVGDYDGQREAQRQRQHGQIRQGA